MKTKKQNWKLVVDASFICQRAGEILPENENGIQTFSLKYAVEQDLVVKHMKQLAYLYTRKQNRERERREWAKRESNLG